MRDVATLGPYKDTVLVPSPLDSDSVLDPKRFVRMGVMVATFRRMVDYGLATAIAQYYGNVQEGLGLASEVHLFKGLERELLHGGNAKADRDMLMFSWVPEWDWEWDSLSKMPIRRKPPSARVFTFTARPHVEPDEHGVVGTILHWGWKDEDSMLRAAPIGPSERFASKVWSKRK